MNVLIVGGSNLLGRYLLRSVPDGWNATATWYTNYTPGCAYQLDLTNQSQVNYVFGRVKPQVVLHLAAIGDVDWAEAHPQETYAVNVVGLRNVIAACKDYRARLVYTSSNAVFKGDNPPYAEDAPREPVNVYGRTRKQAEDVLMQGDNWLILRLFLLFGWPPPGARSNWVQTVVQNLRQGEPVWLVDDAYWQPTYAGFAADGIWKAVQFELKNEVVHLASDVAVSLYILGRNTAQVFGLAGPEGTKLVQPIPSKQLPSKLAPRPVNSTYDLEKSKRLGLDMPGLTKGLMAMRDETQIIESAEDQVVLSVRAT